MRPHMHTPSARELRRAAQHRAGRRQRPTSRPVHIPMIVKADYVLAPLEAVLAQLELRGTIDVTADDTPVFQAADGSVCATAPAIDGIADFFEQWAIRHGRVLDVSALHQVAKRLEYGMPLDGPMLDRVRETLPALRRIAGALDREAAISLITGTQIKAELDARTEGSPC